MSKDARVEVVLINYKRPRNIPDLIHAFRNQTEKCHITLIDAAPAVEFALGEDTRHSVDHLLSWQHEFGPYNRYVPIAVYSHQFTYFHDDDMLPGKRALEHFTKVADAIERFGVLGQMGRNADATGAYIPQEVHRTSDLVPVDFVVRGYFVRTTNLPAVIQLRHKMGLSPGVDLEDDLLLCASMTAIHGLTNFLTPNDDDRETRMNRAGLSSDYARFKRGIHLRERTAFCRKAMGVGWVPLCQRPDDAGLNEQPETRVLIEGGTPMPEHTQVGSKPEISADAVAIDDTVLRSESQTQDSKAKWSDFNVNEYWLKRGETYIDEKRLYTDPYRLQEDFILDTLLRRAVPMGNVLELGCGFGRITKRLARTFADSRISAVDISPDQLRNARENCAVYADRTEFIQYDIYSSERLPGTAFDTAIAVEVFMHHPHDAVVQVIERLSEVADCIVNYDRHEDRLGRVAKHVWIHDYEEIYRNLGWKCKTFVEPQKFNGQQQKLFIASRKSKAPSVRDRGRKVEHSVNFDSKLDLLVESQESPTEIPHEMAEKQAARSNGARLSMKKIESKIPSDQTVQATLDYYLTAYPETLGTVNVLDLGCGTGKSYDAVKAHIPDFTWTGVDIAESPEVRSRSRSDCEFVTFDGVNLPFDDDCFDLVLSVQVFEHVRYPDELLREVARVLRPGGLFIGSVSQLEPFHSNSFWNFTYYGFANLAFDAGLGLRELRPGIDGLTLIVRNILNHGFGRSVSAFNPYFKSLSPLNRLFESLLMADSADKQHMNRLMLRYCGHFWFVFELPGSS